MKEVVILLVVSANLLGLILIGCSDPSGPENSFNVTLTASNFEHLEPGQGHYELWISFPVEEETGAKLGKAFHEDEEFVSFGKFNVSSAGQILSLNDQPMTFSTDGNVDINLAVDAIITIEVGDGSDSDGNEPGSRIIGGVFTGTDDRATVTLTTSNEDAFDFDYSTASASYILDTPTTSLASDFNSGLWWVTPGAPPGVSAGITNLAALTDTSGWIYEGWIVDNSAFTTLYYSTGKFLSAGNTDADLAGASAGTDSAGYLFPGQDFIQAVNNLPATPQLDNGNFEVRITLEPEPDNSPLPFQLPIFSDPLIGPNVQDANTVLTMENRAQSFPTATVTILRNISNVTGY